MIAGNVPTYVSTTLVLCHASPQYDRAVIPASALLLLFLFFKLAISSLSARISAFAVWELSRSKIEHLETGSTCFDEVLKSIRLVRRWCGLGEAPLKVAERMRCSRNAWRRRRVRGGDAGAGFTEFPCCRVGKPSKE